MVEERPGPGVAVHPGGEHRHVVPEVPQQQREGAVELVAEAAAAPGHDLVDESGLVERDRLAEMDAQVLERHRRQVPAHQRGQGRRRGRLAGGADPGEVGVGRGVIHARAAPRSPARRRRRRCWARRGRRRPARSGARCAMAYDVPAQSSIARSLGMSPNASTSSGAIPRSAHSRASVVALVTPAALISSIAAPDDQVTTTRSPTAASARSQNSCGEISSCRASSLSAGPSKISSTGPRRASSGIALRSRKPGSSAMPGSVSTAKWLPGTASRISRQTSSPTTGSMVRACARRRAATSQTRPPLEHDRQAVAADVVARRPRPAQRPAGDEDDRDAAPPRAARSTSPGARR